MSIDHGSTARVMLTIDRLGIAADLAEELAEVTEAMLDAGVAAALNFGVLAGATTAQEFAAIWRAMLAAKLTGVA